MEINDIISSITFLRKQLDNYEHSTNDLLRFISHFRLDWADSNDNFSDSYNIGATKPILISGLATDSHKIRQSSIIYQNSEIAKTLVTAFSRGEMLTPQLLQNIHGLIIRNGGIWRNQTVIIDQKSTLISPPFSNYENVEKEIGELTDWYNTENKSGILHPLIIASIFHHRLLLIHPFLDGNGRIARIFSSMILLEKRLPPPIMYPKDRITYLSCLRNADSEDSTPLILFLGQKVIHSLEYMISLKKKF